MAWEKVSMSLAGALAFCKSLAYYGLMAETGSRDFADSGHRVSI